MKTELKRVFVIAGFLCLGQSAVGQTDASNFPRFVSGKDLYIQKCAVCHGTVGQGDGVLALNFSPQPRNFVFGTFRYRSTGLGEPPAQEDLVRVIQNGIEGSYGRSMPAFDDLEPNQVISLTNFVKELSGFDEFGVPTEVPPQPAVKNIAQGQRLFQDNGCHECHGETGDGLGVLAADLRDEDNNSIRPANLSLGIFKGGNAPENVFLRIKYGIDGTPMPSFGRNLSAEELWALTDFVLSLSESP